MNQQDIERLKNNWVAWGGLSNEDRAFLANNLSNVLIFGSKLICGPCGWHHIASPLGACSDKTILRLSPDFTLPIEAPDGYKIVPHEKRSVVAFPEDCNIKYPSWDGKSFRNVSNPDSWINMNYEMFVPLGYVFAEDRVEKKYQTQGLGNIIKPSEPIEIVVNGKKHRFVDCDVFEGTCYGMPCYKIKRNGNIIPYENINGLVGFAGVQFEGQSDKKAWHMETASGIDTSGRCLRIMDIHTEKPATPVRARFWVEA